MKYRLLGNSGLRVSEMALDEASRIELGFPHEMFARDLVRGLMYGGMGDKIIV